MSIGLVATVLFHVFLKGNLLENSNAHKGNIEETRRLIDNSQSDRTSWVSTTMLLRVAMLYVASRLFITLATVYLPLYIEESDVDGKEALATVPLASYISSFVAALLLKYINKSCGTKVRVWIEIGVVKGKVALRFFLSGMLLLGHFDRYTFRRDHGIRWTFRVSHIRSSDFNRKCKLDHDGHGVERDCGNNWTANRAKRHRLLDSDFSR